MASRRTISYIGLWALIMPWLGFSWETKTLLFSLTGILLLVIGNRHYHSDKKKNSKDVVRGDGNPNPNPNPNPNLNPHLEKKIEKEVKESFDMPAYNTVPDYMQTMRPLETKPQALEVKEDEIASSNPVFVTVEESKPKPRTRKRIEITPRVRKTDSRPISLDSLETDYEQNQL